MHQARIQASTATDDGLRLANDARDLPARGEKRHLGARNPMPCETQWIGNKVTRGALACAICGLAKITDVVRGNKHMKRLSLSFATCLAWAVVVDGLLDAVSAAEMRVTVTIDRGMERGAMFRLGV